MLEGGGVFLAFQSCGSWTLNLFSSFTRELARRRWSLVGAGQRSFFTVSRLMFSLNQPQPTLSDRVPQSKKSHNSQLTSHTTQITNHKTIMNDNPPTATPTPTPTNGSSSEITPRIKPLPKKVVDRIAAGEVVQRPASVVKELIENSLDAHSSSIDVQCSAGGMRLLSITDDGDGLHPDDFKLAATRFATSKLANVDDLKNMQTFGFRGEALASASMVGRLTIVSRKRARPGMNSKKQSCAFKMSYTDGAPCGKAVPSAGKEGTCVKLEDLFYNLPSRKRAFEGTRKENEEYQKILDIVQRYAVHKAASGVGFVCRKKGGATDLNTTSIMNIKNMKKLRLNTAQSEDGNNCSEQKKLRELCTRDAIGHVFGRDTTRELLLLECGEGNVRQVSLAALEAMKSQNSSETVRRKQLSIMKEGNTLIDGLIMGNDYGATIAKESDQPVEPSQSGQFSFAYKAYGFITNGSYCVPKSSSAFLLFINGRLVQSAPLKRAVEGVYLDMLPKGAKPFIYLSLELPGPHLDVNVHPTKREVAFLHEDRLCDALATVVRGVLRSNTTSRTFYTQTLLPDDNKISKRMQTRLHDTLDGEEKKQQSKDEDSPTSRDNNSNDESLVNEDGNSKTSKRRRVENGHEKIPNKRKSYDPKNLIRNNGGAEQGALEPFLVRTQPNHGSQSTQSSQDATNATTITQANRSMDNTIFEHSPDCELASTSKKIDLTIPGAFASICRCQVERAASLPHLPSTVIATPAMRPKKIVATQCSYTSIETLRNDIQIRSHRELTSKLRDSIFVGCINRKRCLLQSGIELLMVNHYELSKELFYQLSVLRFGGFDIAELGNGGVDVKALIEESLHFDDPTSTFASLSQGGDSDINSTQDEINSELASQATKCLLDQAEMFLEYFSIKLEMKQDPASQSEKSILMLTGLPIILDGHTPSPHALPTFLHRLATEVDWTEERPCFEGVCTELGSYYAEIPYQDVKIPTEKENLGKLELMSESEMKFVQHTLFPALRFLLVLPKEFATDGSFCKLALLSKLYRVFERC